MDMERLKQAEESFLTQYPAGFEHPEMIQIGKKHRIDQLVARANSVLAPERFNDWLPLTEDIVKTVTASSMVSVFEKPKFRDYIRSLPPVQQARLCTHVYQLLYGDM
ncbi:MAG: hypothetical protein ACOCVC_01845 [Spirochaeta sp.]